MTQSSILELAKQGNAPAIAALINRSLQPKGITASAVLKHDCLEVSLHSAQTPNQKALEALIYRGMTTLQVEVIQVVRLFAYRAENNVLLWESEFRLGRSSLYQPAEPAPSTGTALERQAPHGLALVPIHDLSQLVQTPQEYQDIVIRFLDTRFGTVKCLTTLTEFLQAVDKTSFSFAAVASNPSLRGLLDTIAELTIADENGDRLITSASILQPGQPWQNVRIRLSTKIYFEAESFEPAAHLKPTVHASSPRPAIVLEDIETPEPPPEPAAAAASPPISSPTPTQVPVATTTLDEFVADLGVNPAADSAERPRSPSQLDPDSSEYALAEFGVEFGADLEPPVAQLDERATEISDALLDELAAAIGVTVPPLNLQPVLNSEDEDRTPVLLDEFSQAFAS